MTKEEIRKHYLQLRQGLTEIEYNKLNQGLSDKFFLSIDLSTTNTLQVFLPIVSKKEPNTWLIIDRLAKEFPNIRVCIPRIKESTLINFYFEGRDQIKDNKWNIPEPQFGEIIPVDKIDLVIVPLLAFDLKGNRVGYGKGFYDRFLKECRPACKKVGLSMFEPVERISNIGIFDIKLDLIITPSRAIQPN